MIIKKRLVLKAPPHAVWQALTDPALTKQYMFGCQAISDWQVGSPLEWTGQAEGAAKVFVKGAIVEFEPERLLAYTVFAPDSGLADVPANYTTVVCKLTPKNDGTLLEVSQGDFAPVADGEARYAETVGGWEMALEGLRQVLER